MKSDLTTSILAAIVGVVVAFFLTNLLLPEIEDITINVLSSSPSTNLASPDPEIFNYRAINPTVEVYVGQCTEYNEKGECVNIVTDTNNQDDDKYDYVEDDNVDNADDDNDADETDDDFNLLDDLGDNSNTGERTRNSSNGGSN